jgi:hypothetical protein
MTGSSSFFFANTGSDFYNGIATQSLRFDDGDNASLTRTPTSAGNRKMWTTSFWVKRTEIDDAHYLWSSTGANDGIAAIYFNSDNKIHTYYDTSGANPYGAVGDRLFRDTTNWLNIVWAVDAANTIHKIWVNNELISTDTGKYPPNYSFNMNNTAAHKFGDPAWGASSDDFDGYLAHFVHLDGQYLEPDSFGETKNGVWIPIDTSGLTFGTNGFQLEFKQTGTGTASTSTIGADTSGNTNHLTSTNLVASDSNLPDCPENNFCTLNPLNKQSSSTLSEGNLKATIPGGGNSGRTASTFSVNSGKWYWEIRQMSSNRFGTGVFDVDNYVFANEDGGVDAYEWIYLTSNNASAGGKQNGGTAATYGEETADGQVIMVALDCDNDAIYFGKEGSWFNTDGSSNSATVKAQIEAGTTTNAMYTGVSGRLTPCCMRQTSDDTLSFNFGQDDTFQGNETAAGNTDSNSKGSFLYAPPSGFLALCSSNLTSPAISPDKDTQATDYFDTLLYTGNNQSAQDIGGLAFKPDWVIIKGRSYTDWGMHFDSSRGTGKTLQAFRTYAEGDYANTLDEFRSDGFGLGADSTAQVNYQTNTYVAFNWKANGGAASATGTESGNTLAYSTQVNSDSGFAIVTYTGNGADSADITVNHALGSTPAMVIVKNRTDGSSRYQVYHQSLTSGENILLDSTNGESAYTSYIKAVSSSTFTVRDVDADGNLFVNKDNSNYVAYVFAEVEGFSRFGKYVGNGSTTGPYVYCGFRPAFLVVKEISANGEDWMVWDSKRNPTNEVYLHHYWNTNSAETGSSGGSTRKVDFLSNGFRTTVSHDSTNTSGETYIYMAFAEQPFKFSNAR